MKVRSIFKIATISSVILLSIGFAMFFYLRIAKVEKTQDVNLYTLIPPSAIAIVDSDNMVDLLKGINELSCNEPENFHPISYLFSQLKDHITTLENETPHGFSRQLSKMVISFHEPDNNKNQVFYSRLGVGDKDIVDKFIKKYCESNFPSKYFKYKGEEIKIYSMPDDTFLAYYITSDFLAVSYQKKLIEQVIDAKLSEKSILHVPGFTYKPATARSQHPATIHLKTKSLNLADDSIQLNLGEWTQFNLKVSNDMIYLAGVSHVQDSTSGFLKILRKQQPLKIFPGDMLPASTYYLSNHSISDFHSIANSSWMNDKPENNLLTFLKEYASYSATICMFRSSDSLYTKSCIVANIPVITPDRAERFFRNMSVIIGNHRTYTGNHLLRGFADNAMQAQLTGINNTSGFLYASFYNGSVLIAPDVQSLISYINEIESGNTLKKDSLYELALNNLSNSYNFLLMADLKELKNQSSYYPAWIPDFFSEKDIFQNFVLTSQFTYMDGNIYPNLVLLYKGDGLLTSYN